MVLNSLEFSFATCAEDVGMKTGATIHTMNGLNMIVQKRSSYDKPEEDDGWWEQQHLKRGLDVTGRPYANEEDAVWSKSVKTRKVDPASKADNTEAKKGGCPVQH